MPYSFIKYKDKKIFYVDHRGLVGDKLLNSIKEAAHFVLNNKKEVLFMADFTGTIASQEVMDYLKSDEVKSSQKYFIKQAIVGIKGIKMVFLNVYNKFTSGNLKAFDTEEEAKEWLIKE